MLILALQVLDSNTGVVWLANLSIKQHLEESRPYWCQESQKVIAYSYMTFLSFRDFYSDESNLQNILRLCQVHPFLEYAVSNWGFHARVLTAEACFDRSVHLLKNDQKADLLFRILYATAFKTVESCPEDITGLHLAAYFDMHETIKALLEEGQLVDSFDSFDRTPLYIAATLQNVKSVQVLLDNKASPSGRPFLGDHDLEYYTDSTTHWWLTPWGRPDITGHAVEVAAETGSTEVVRLLIDAGESSNKGGGVHGSPLEAAISLQREDVVQLLLDNDAWPTPSALQATVYAGNINITRQVLQSIQYWEARPPPDIPLEQRYNSGNWDHKTRYLRSLEPPASTKDLPYALYAAALANSFNCLQEILKYHVEINAETSGFYRTALQAAARQGNTDIMQVLINRGADIDDCSAENVYHDDYYAHAKLFGLPMKNWGGYGFNENPDLTGYKATEEQRSIYRESGLKPTKQFYWDGWNTKDQRYGSPLQAAAYNERVEALLLLLKLGANVNVYSGCHGTALQAAAAAGSIISVKMLLKHGAHVNTLSGFFGNPLQAAASGGYETIVQLLINAGADVNAKGGAYGYPLIAASRGCNVRVLELLLDAGANIHVSGGEYHGPIQTAVMAIPKDVISIEVSEYTKPILEQAPNLDKFYRLANDRCIAWDAPGERVFGYLISISAGGLLGVEQSGFAVWKRHSEDKYLDMARRSSSYAVVECLLNNGADANEKGGTYETALQAAARTGKSDVVKLLLERGAQIEDTLLANSSVGDGSFKRFYRDSKRNALIEAVADGSLEIVKLLLDAGANPDMQAGRSGDNTLNGTKYSTTPLKVVAAAKDDTAVQIARVLLRGGAVLSSSPGLYYTNRSPLQIAVSQGVPAMVALFLETANNTETQNQQQRLGDIGLKSLCPSSWDANDIKKLALLLKAGPQQDSIDQCLRRILSANVYSWNRRDDSDLVLLEGARLLVKQGANVTNGRNEPAEDKNISDVRCPLLIASENSDDKADFVDLLATSGVDIQKMGEYPLQRAVELSHHRVVKTLISHGARPCQEVIHRAKLSLGNEADYSASNFRDISERRRERERAGQQLLKRRQEILNMLLEVSYTTEHAMVRKSKYGRNVAQRPVEIRW